MEKIVTCKKCGGNLAYLAELNSIEVTNCLVCGFTSHSDWTEDNEQFKEEFQLLPQLYQDFKFTDLEGKIWVPSTMNFPEKFMIFLKGTTVNDARWAGVKATEVKPEEKTKFKKPGKTDEFYTHKVDMATLKEFENFFEACQYVGLI